MALNTNTVENAALIQKAALSEGNIVAAELKKLENNDRRNNNIDRQVEAEGEVSRLLQGTKDTSNAGLNILSALVSKLSSAGVSLNPDKLAGKLRDDIENEYEKMVGSQSESFDEVSLRSSVGEIAGKKRDKNNDRGGDGRQDGSGEGRQGKQAPAQEYAALYAQYTVGKAPGLKKKLEKCEDGLREMGFSQKDLISIRTAASNPIRNELTEQIRQAYTKKILSREKSIELRMSDHKLNEILDFGLLKGLHDDQSLQAVADDVNQEPVDRLKDFTREKLEEKLTGKFLASDKATEKSAEKELKELVKLSAKIGFDLNEFSRNWQAKKEHLGLFVFDVPVGQAQSGMNPDQNNQRQNSSASEFTADDEKDLLASRLRAIHMHRALAGDIKTNFETFFKMRKLKNGLIKLGVGSNELERIEKEGKAAARERLMEMLKTTLTEKATLYEFAGPAFALLEQKIKGLKSNLERLDFGLSEDEFAMLWDNANQKVYEAARAEMLSLVEILDGGSDPMIERRLMIVQKLMKRISDEAEGMRAEDAFLAPVRENA